MALVLDPEYINLRNWEGGLLLQLISVCKDDGYAVKLQYCSSKFTCSSSFNSTSLSAALTVLQLCTGVLTRYLAQLSLHGFTFCS